MLLSRKLSAISEQPGRWVNRDFLTVAEQNASTSSLTSGESHTPRHASSVCSSLRPTSSTTPRSGTEYVPPASNVASVGAPGSAVSSSRRQSVPSSCGGRLKSCEAESALNSSRIGVSTTGSPCSSTSSRWPSRRRPKHLSQGVSHSASSIDWPSGRSQLMSSEAHRRGSRGR